MIKPFHNVNFSEPAQEMEYETECETEQEYVWRYIDGPDECECLENYWTGGYHPVDIGDQFCDGKYTIVHKLGSGGAATVWLAQTKDGDKIQYVALKILSADFSKEDDNELKIHKHLHQKIADGHKLSSVALLLDSFWIEGPNGKHLCLAFEPAGPSLMILNRQKRKFRPDVARALGLQIAQGLRGLHDAGVVYGDLSTSNVLLNLVDFHSWTVDELYERIGRPVPWDVETTNGQPPDCHAPKVVYEPIQFSYTSFEYLQPEVVFVDLADGRLLKDSDKKRASGYSVPYASPETLWFHEMQDKASDVWAMGCIFFELRSAAQLFDQTYSDPENARMAIEETIGAIPLSWANRLPPQDGALEGEMPQEEFSEEVMQEKSIPEADVAEEYVLVEEVHESAQPMDGIITEGETRSFPSMKSRLHKAWVWFMSLFRTLKTNSDIESNPADMPYAVPEPYFIPEYFRPKKYVPQDPALHARIERIGQWEEWHYLDLEERVRRMKEANEKEYGHKTIADVDDEPPPGPLSDDEKADLNDILSSIIKYEKADRKVLDEIVVHPWLNKSYEEAREEPWMKEYTHGWSFTDYTKPEDFYTPCVAGG